MSLLLEQLSDGAIQSVGMDGFHHYQEYLDTHMKNGVCLKSIKGHPDTFDVDLLYEKLQEASCGKSLWPVYSRMIHDPVADAVSIEKDIVLIEGNYLLLDDARWEKLRAFCDFRIFISCDEELVKSRLIMRKSRGGLTYDEAREHYESSDSKNVQLILHNRVDADVCLSYDGYRYHEFK